MTVFEEQSVDYLPPHDLEAEACALGLAMQSPNAAATIVEELTAEDFFRSAHGLIHRAIERLVNRSEAVNMVSVHAEFEHVRDGKAPVPDALYVHSLVGRTPIVGDISFYTKRLRGLSQLRGLGAAGMQIAALRNTPVDDVDHAVELANKVLDEATKTAANGTAAPISELITPFLDSLEAGEDMRGVTTGWKDVDDVLVRLRPGQLIVIGARPGMGKSNALLHMAHHVAVKLGLPAWFGTMEMSKDECIARLLAKDAQVDLKKIIKRELTDADWEKIRPAHDRLLAADTLVLDDEPGMGIGHIRAALRAQRRTGQPFAFAAADYLQLLRSPGRVENRQVEVSGFSRSLKLLAKEFELPIAVGSQLNRNVEDRADKRPGLADLRESGCLTGDTALLRADTGAPVTFDTLLRDGWDGVLVWSLDEARRLVAAPVTNVFATGVKQVFRMRMASGRVVSATANHRFLALNGWRRLDSLAPGDRIGIPRRTPAPIASGIGWSKYRLGLLAHLIGDGCVLRSQPVHYTSEDEANRAFVEAAAAAEFGITARRIDQGTWQHVYLPAPWRCTHGRGNPLHAWFRELGIDDRRSYEKRIPDAIFAASDDETAVFLRHLWATDGSISEPSSKANGAPHAYYSTSSRALADGVALLLSRFGIVARIGQVKQGKHRPNYHVKIADTPSLRVFCQRIGVHGDRGKRAQRLLAEITERIANTNTDSLPREVWDLVKSERMRAGLTERQFQAAIGTSYCGSTLYKACPSRKRLLRCADALDSDLLREAASSDVFWDKVVAIEAAGEQPVYDATVKGTHNFIADGVVAHNSIEQDADIVVMLYRDDYYNPESPDAGEVEFNIEKNRQGPKARLRLAFRGHYARIDDLARQCSPTAGLS